MHIQFFVTLYNIWSSLFSKFDLIFKSNIDSDEIAEIVKRINNPATIVALICKRVCFSNMSSSKKLILESI